MPQGTKGGITPINWTVYGKVAKVVKGEYFTEYRYDASDEISGNRSTAAAG
ncbi:hypothetical protein AAG747_28190 [Rapidithrix thailandica]|uniref:Uncharacterized protein n=1 Tax=Rapidithrix thailandica TaxID=413964 RepID=A0AAW9SG67_9BACT